MVAGLFAQPASTFSTLAAQADAARQSDRLEEAATLYRKALQVKPTWVEGWWYLGTLLYDRDDYAGAATALQKAAAIDPKAANTIAMLGLSEAKLNRTGPALQHLERALNIGIGTTNNMRPVVLFTRANLLLSAGEFGKAQDALNSLTREGVDQPELVVALGESVLGIRPVDLPSAGPETHEAVQRAGQAEQLAARREVKAALAAYDKLAADYPKLHNVQFAYGRFLLANHQDEQAVAAFRRELDNSPQHLLARLGLAGILLTTQPAAGLPYAQQAVQLAPKLEESHYLLGACLLATGAVDQAIPELVTARHLDPNDARVYFRLDRAYTLTKRPQDAARARAEFIRLNKTKPE